MDHPQLATPIVSDNSSAVTVTNGTNKQRRSRAIDIHFYWIQDKIKQRQFLVFWTPGANNMSDYPTKNHPTYHTSHLSKTKS